MNEPSQNGSVPKLRIGQRVSLGDRAGVLRYRYGPDAAVVHFDHEAKTKVVPLRRLVASTDEHPLPER